MRTPVEKWSGKDDNTMVLGRKLFLTAVGTLAVIAVVVVVAVVVVLVAVVRGDLP